jgi:chemotaxis response regulator CheB
VAIVQNPGTAEVSVMPAAALEAVPDSEVLSLDQLASRLVDLDATAQAPGRR